MSSELYSDLPRATGLYRLYSALTTLLGPLAWRRVARRLGDYGVSEVRQKERLGHATLPRPPRSTTAPLLWFHAASVGESLSVLTLIRRLGELHPEAEFLITSGTPTSADLVEKRMPPRCRHQFPPLDTRAAVDRFLAHWQPDLGVFVESELWPQMIVRARDAGCALVLLNARLSERSVKGWVKRPKTARFLLARFGLFITQNQTTAENLARMGAAQGRIRPGSNLKAFSAPLPVAEDVIADMRARLGTRPLWVASSTHRGEEETVLSAHQTLLVRQPDLCLLLAPRHPERGDEIEALITDAGLSLARRSRGEVPDGSTQVYLADTLGEVGTWYALCPRVFMGGSLLEIGGHNPFETAQAGAAVITGPGYFNFSETYGEMIARGAAVEVRDADSLAQAMGLWLQDEAQLKVACAAASAYIAQQSDQLDKTATALLEQLAAV